MEETGQEEPLIPEVSTAPLLKPFISNSAKQARFDAYQLLVRQGLSRKFYFILFYLLSTIVAHGEAQIV